MIEFDIAPCVSHCLRVKRLITGIKGIGVVQHMVEKYLFGNVR